MQAPLVSPVLRHRPWSECPSTAAARVRSQGRCTPTGRRRHPRRQRSTSGSAQLLTAVVGTRWRQYRCSRNALCYVGTNKEGVTHSVESQCLIHGVIMCGTTWVVPPVLKQLQLLVPHGLVVGASRVEGVHFTRVASILPHEHEALATLVRKLLRRCVVVERIKQRLAQAALCGVSGRTLYTACTTQASRSAPARWCSGSWSCCQQSSQRSTPHP